MSPIDDRSGGQGMDRETGSIPRRRPWVDHLDRYVDDQEEESFPASDPHSDWSGPPTWLRSVGSAGPQPG